jgi:hypothetical protein
MEVDAHPGILGMNFTRLNMQVPTGKEREQKILLTWQNEAFYLQWKAPDLRQQTAPADLCAGQVGEQ